VCDLNLRLAYEPSWGRARLVLDFLQLGNPRETVAVDQPHYFAEDENGNPTNRNAACLSPIAYQPPMAARLGLEISF
jgi:hypothetical protein